MTRTSLGHKLRVLRAERGLTLRDAASRTGVAKETISDIERGIRHPHDVTVAKLAEGYGVPVEDLLALEEPAPLGDAQPPSEKRGLRIRGKDIATEEASREINHLFELKQSGEIGWDEYHERLITLLQSYRYRSDRASTEAG